MCAATKLLLLKPVAVCSFVVGKTWKSLIDNASIERVNHNDQKNTKNRKEE